MLDSVFGQNKYLECVLDRFEGRVAVLKTADGETFNWPLDKIPSDLNEGATVKLVLFSSKNEEEEREKIAKAVLNEILKTD